MNEVRPYAKDEHAIRKIDLDPFGVVELLREKYGEALLNDCHGYEVVGAMGEVTQLKLNLFVTRNPAKDDE